MCGRYTYTDPDRIREAMVRDFGYAIESELPGARYNVSPSQSVPVVSHPPAGAGRISAMRWGLVPFWDKSDKPKFAPINARSEEILAKPMFRQPLQHRRCLVPADGFYEWKRLDERTKIPHFIARRGREPFFIAGIYESATELRPETFALLTTGPNELMRTIHDRMPVILHGEAARRWLEAGPVDAARLAGCCRSFPAEDMEAVPVSRLVNSPRNDLRECLLPALEG